MKFRTFPIAGLLLLLLVSVHALPVEAAPVYYSVGTSVADLKTGSPTITMSAGTATFSIAQATNVGVGDEITYNGSTRAYISGRISSTQYTVTTATGGTPANVTGQTVDSIRRAFNTLSAAEANSSNATHLNTADLVGSNIQLNWPCYNDGIMTDAVQISGYTTGPSNYIRVYTPTASSEVGVSQRHRGALGTGFQLSRTNADIIQIYDAHVRIEGLSFQATVNSAGWFGGVQSFPAGASDVRISHNVIKGVVTAGNPAYGIMVGTNSANVHRVWDNVVYNFTNTGSEIGLGIDIDDGVAYVFNNTVFNCQVGILKYSAVAGSQVKNNVSINFALNASFADYLYLATAPAAVRATNVSSDATSETASLRNKTAYATYFKNTTPGSEDLHLLQSSLAAWGSNGTDLSGDANLPVTNDIDGSLRARPDIGADEFSACCGLVVTEGAGTVTVTGTGSFELGFSEALGGGIDKFYDLVEDPGKATDLVGGVSEEHALLGLELQTAPSGTWYETDQANGFSRAQILEATPTRVRVRQDSFLTDTGPAWLPGSKAVGDHSIYGTGRSALRWTWTSATPISYYERDINLATNWTGTGNPQFKPCEQGVGCWLNTGTGPEDFVLQAWNMPTKRTDFLTILSTDWAQANDLQSFGLSGAPDDWWWSGWIESSGTPNTPASQSWSLLTYFKPTNFVDDTDTAVTSRSTDYRGPSGLTMLTGGPWQLASENTGGGDDFNEAEGAYVLTLDPTNGATFRIDGSIAIPRYQPFFKIRHWRSLSGPGSITLQGAPLTAGVDFQADVKPISRAHFANILSWHSTLESAGAVTTPDVGSAGTVTGGVTFVTGKYGSAGSFTATGNYVTAPFDNFNIAIGTVEFWYRPNYDCQPAPINCDGIRHTLWIMEGDATHFLTVEKTVANRLDFAIRNGGTTTVVRVALPDFGWRANDWVHIRAMWNDVAPPNQTMRLFINEKEPPHLDVGGDYNSAGMPVGPTRVGGDSAGVTTAAGLIDEFHIYRGGVTPTRFGYAGLAAHVDEYLAVGTPARNVVLLTTGVDPGRRGQYVYFGADSEFRGLNVALATPGAGVADGDLIWEYWNGSAWTSLESVGGFTDQTRSFKQSGSVFWQDPPTWTPYSVNGGPDLYYVRVHLPATTIYSTIPVEALIKTDILLLQYCSDITAAAREFAIPAPAPTAVTLSSFSAAALDSAVELSWTTASELQNLGFHLYRADSEDGPYERITSAVIPGLGSSPHGASYRYTDSGLSNGSTYFYKLEDIETTGATKLHGPVSAIPSSEAIPTAPSTSSLIEYGNAEGNGFRIVRRTSRGAVLELVTEGFHAEPQDDGTVRISIPGFDTLSELSLPVLRPWIEAATGRNVVITGVQPSGVESFSGLRPAGAEIHEIVATREGTVRAGRRSRRAFLLQSPGLLPEEAARLLQVGYQGDAKKAQLELAPLRWNGSTGELLFARKLTVHLAFRGKEADSGDRRASRGAGSLLARLATTKKGLHEVRYEDLFRARRSFALSQLRLSRLGVPVAIHVEPAIERFAPGSRLYFLSEGSDANPYGREAVYELEISASGRVMDLGSAFPSGEELGSYLETDDYEENRLYQAGLLDAPDLWLWDVLMAPSTKSFSFEASGLQAGSSSLTVWLQGTSDFDANPDHHVRLYVNGTFQQEAFWDGKESRTLQLLLPEGTLRDGENALEIENVGDTQAPYSMVMLDKFHVVYPRVASAEEGNLEGVWTRSGTASASGLGASHLLDVTEGAPRWLSGAELSAEGRLLFRAEAGRRYLAVSHDAVHRPLVRNAVSPRLERDDLRADYLVIAPSELAAAAAPLLAHRSQQGLRVKLAALEEVYDEFGFGERRPEAIRDFLSYAYHHWREPKLRYVLLLGDATYDFKDQLQTGVTNQLPPLMVKTSYLWTASDPAYAAIHGEDLLPDMAIGRLPAKDPEELRAMVSKILDYETGAASLESLLVLVTDDSDRAGEFDRDAQEIEAGVLSGRPIRRLSLDELGASMRGEILRAFDEGASLVSYAGHGGIHLWADENVLNTGDVASLSIQPQQPLLLTMNCLNGYFHFPYFDSLAESLLKAEGKGAVAAFSPSGLSLNEPAHRFHVALLDAVFNHGHQRLGDAVLAAQEEYAASGAFPELLSIYHLLGDPGLKLR